MRLAQDLIPDYQTSNASSLDESDSWDSDVASIDSQATEKAWECLKCGTNVIMPMKFCFTCNQVFPCIYRLFTKKKLTDSINLNNKNPFFFSCIFRNAKVTFPHVQLSLRGLRRKHLLLLHVVRLLLHRLPSATRLLSPQAHLLLVRLPDRLRKRTTSALYVRDLAMALFSTVTVPM